MLVDFRDLRVKSIDGKVASSVKNQKVMKALLPGDAMRHVLEVG